MILIELFLGFLRVGCFSFGGAYSAIPLIRDVVLSYGWLDDDTLSYLIAVSESTPGPIMVNLATYVGSSQGGFLGAVLATLAVVLPSFVIILLVTAALKTALKNQFVQALLRGLKPCIIGIILATGTFMIIRNCFAAGQAAVSIHALVITLLLFAALYLPPKFQKKKLPPIALIVLSACLGVLVYSIY